MERCKFSPARDEDHPAYTVPNLSHKQQAVIGELLSLSRVQTSESGTEEDIETVALPIEPVKNTLAQLNPEKFPPVHNSIGTMDLTMLDGFGTDKPYKKGEKGPVYHRPQTSAAPQNRPP